MTTRLDRLRLPDGREIRLGRMLGQGGEGAVHEVQGVADLVAKTYHKPIDDRKQRKLRVMSRAVNSTLTRVAAWPAATLHAQANGPIVGILLPRMRDNRPVHDLYNPASRKKHFATADLKFLLHASRNIAAAFAVLHRHGCVIGDVNQGNVWVHKTQATAMLIDCDSFQFAFNGEQFLCEVGVGHFTPPELQSITSFADIGRTKNHDYFGLAVLIFHLLFFGRHPYAGRVAARTELRLEDAIARNLFAYSSASPKMGVSPPPGAMPLAYLGQNIELMFSRAFGPRSPQPRPASEEWMRELERVETELQRCAAEGAHTFPRSMIECLWCDLEDKQGLSYFVPRTIGRLYDSNHFSLNLLWSQVEAVPLPAIASSINPASMKVEPTPYPKWRGAIAHTWKFLGILGAVALIAQAPAWFWIWGTLGYFLWTVSPLTDPEVRRRDEAYEQANSNFASLAKKWQESAGRIRFTEVRNELEALKRQHDQLQAKYIEMVGRMRTDARNQQLQRFLERFSIASAKIDGVGQSRKETLVSFGIFSAADITYVRLQGVPGIGEVTSSRLLGWRSHLEARFAFDPTRADDPQTLARINRQIDQERKSIEQRLVTRLAELQAVGKRVEAERLAMRGPLYAAAHAVAQATADKSAIHG